MDMYPKVFNSFTDVLHSNLSCLNEFAVVPCLKDFMSEPCQLSLLDGFILIDDKFLAISEDVSKPLYLYCHQMFFQMTALHEEVSVELLQSATSILVLLNPDLMSAWNFRKSKLSESSENQKVERFMDEFHLCRLCLSWKPKNQLVFAHLSHLLQQLIYFVPHLVEVQNLLRRTFSLCTNWAAKKSLNYNCWNFRRMALAGFLKIYNMELKEKQNVLLSEFHSVDRFLKSAICDSSAWSYKLHLLNNLMHHGQFSNPCDFLALLLDAFHFAQTVSEITESICLGHLYHRIELMQLLELFVSRAIAVVSFEDVQFLEFKQNVSDIVTTVKLSLNLLETQAPFEKNIESSLQRLQKHISMVFDLLSYPDL